MASWPTWGFCCYCFSGFLKSGPISKRHWATTTSARHLLVFTIENSLDVICSKLWEMIVLFYRYRNGNLDKMGNLAEAPELLVVQLLRVFQRKETLILQTGWAGKVGCLWLYLQSTWRESCSAAADSTSTTQPPVRCAELRLGRGRAKQKPQMLSKFLFPYHAFFLCGLYILFLWVYWPSSLLR